MSDKTQNIEPPSSIVCWCPACDQGNVHRVSIEGLKGYALLCDECEALWLDTEQPKASEFWQLSKYMQDKGSLAINYIIIDNDGLVLEKPW